MRPERCLPMRMTARGLEHLPQADRAELGPVRSLVAFAYGVLQPQLDRVEQVLVAEGLLHDAQTRVIYRQVEDEIPRAREILGLTSLEAELLAELDPGVALWKVGSRSFLVQHRLSEPEAVLVDTDGRMRDVPAG